MIASSSDLPPDIIEPHPSSDLLAAVVETHLRQSIKAYGIPTWLILNASHTIAPLWDSRDGERVAALIRKPTGFRYLDAYLCVARSWAEGRQFFRIP